MASKTVPAKKKPTTATDDPQEPSIKTINVNKQAEGNNYKIIKTATTQSLSGACDLEYQLGLSESGDRCLRINSSTGTGLYSHQWISLDEAWKCLTDWDHGPVTALALFPLWKYRSINTAGFVLAILASLELLTTSEEKKRHWDLVSEDQYQATVQALMKQHNASRKGKAKLKS
jgi:hypothetical protein